MVHQLAGAPSFLFKLKQITTTHLTGTVYNSGLGKQKN